MQKKLTVLLAIILFAFFTGCTMPNKKNANRIKPTSPMKLESSVFKNNDYLPTKYTCDGLEINPPLDISDIPDDTKSLVLIMDDPDAPNNTFVHWLVWNISPLTTKFTENSVPPGSTQGTTSAGGNKYVGPCPPSGTHHYYFKVYALDTKLNLPGSTDKAALLQQMQGHVISEAEIVGLYTR